VSAPIDGAECTNRRTALLAALRASIKRDRPPSPPVVVAAPPQDAHHVAVPAGDDREERDDSPPVPQQAQEDQALVIDLDELSSDEEAPAVTLDRSETLSRLQALIEEKERARQLRQQEREEDVGLLQTKCAAQEALLARVVSDIHEKEATLKGLMRRIDRGIPDRLEELRKTSESLSEGCRSLSDKSISS
jgi:hypothetical protein